MLFRNCCAISAADAAGYPLLEFLRSIGSSRSEKVAIRYKRSPFLEIVCYQKSVQYLAKEDRK
jgi:hypothetical protein